MAVIETLRPTSQVSAGAWTAQGAADIESCVDETGTHDGDSTYGWLKQTGVGTNNSSFEVHMANPSTKKWGEMVVRDAGSWKKIIGMWVRDAETWKPLVRTDVRFGGSWDDVIPIVTIRVVARRILVGSGGAQYSIGLYQGGTAIATSTNFSPGTTYAEDSYVVPFNDLLAITNEDDLRVRINGSCTITGDPADNVELRVTQLWMETSE
jgi:hypothetical protein